MIQLISRWGKEIDPGNILQEYPRPNLVRDSYFNTSAFITERNSLFRKVLRKAGFFFISAPLTRSAVYLSMESGWEVIRGDTFRFTLTSRIA